MNFISGAFLGLFGLALPVVVLYILKVRRRPVTVPYLRLWEELVTETRARSLFQRLKRLLSLLLQLLILACLVMALAEPSFVLGSVKKESIVVVIDASASMQAIEADGRTRFELALERASELVEGRSFEDELMLVAAADRVQVLAPFDRSTIRLREGLGRAKQTHRSLDAARAYAFARQVTADKENPVILFLTDGAAGRVGEELGEDENAGMLLVGEATENVGIVRFSARKNTSLGTDYILAVVQNFGEEAREVELELSLDGASQRVLTRSLAPGEVLTERFQMTLDAGGTLRLAVRTVTTGPEDEGGAEGPPDALALDDVAYAVVQPTRLRRIVLVTETREEMEPFRIAFAAMLEVVDETSMAVTAEEYAELDADLKQADLTICLNTLPDSLSPDGNLLLIHTGMPSFLPGRIDGVDAQPVVWDWDREHVLNRYLNYRDLPIPAAEIVRADGGEILVESYEGALVSAYEHATGRAIYVAFDMTGSLFPFRLAFPILLRNSIAWFELEEDVLLEDHYAPGEPIYPLRRLGAEKVVAAWFEDGEPMERELELHNGRFYFAETHEPGPYMFTIDDALEFATCVNLFDAGESFVTPVEQDNERADELAESSSHLLNRDLWTWLALAGLIAWALEWALYHRRLTE